MGASKKGTVMPYYTGNSGIKTPGMVIKGKKYLIKKRKPREKDC
jgi:hypothetical protein